MATKNRSNLFGSRTQQGRGGTHGRGVKKYIHGGRTQGRAPAGSRGNIEQYNCTGMDYSECRSYLNGIMDIPNQQTTFNSWFNALGENNYISIQNGGFNWNSWLNNYIRKSPQKSRGRQFAIGGKIQQTIEGLCHCGHHGIGGCKGGQMCCGVSSGGVGCSYNFAN